MKNITRFISLFFVSIAGLTVDSANGDAHVPNIDGLDFFYQRTIYLENLCQPAAWWANPSLLARIDQITVFTSNTGLIGQQYTISSARIVLPVQSKLNVGFGVTGTGGPTEGRALSVSDQGAQYSSHFNFKLPSLEAGMSYALPVGGVVGALLVTGTESVPDPSNSGLNTIYFFWGISAGWLSPAIFNTVKLSISTLSVCHFQFETWWDKGAKAGLQINTNDGRVLGSFEYGFALFNGPVSFFQNLANFHGYETFKGNVSIKMMDIAGIIFGYSKDSPRSNALDNNGSTFHAGVELRHSDIYPYYGGYEVGISTAHGISLIHRIWVGYSFKKKS